MLVEVVKFSVERGQADVAAWVLGVAAAAERFFEPSVFSGSVGAGCSVLTVAEPVAANDAGAVRLGAA